MVEGTSRGIKTKKEIPLDNYEKDIHSKRVVEIPLNQQERYEYDDDQNILYAGFAARGRAVADTGWLLRKYTNNANGNPTLIQIGYGSWTGRAVVDYS
jgi:hypothetical protein